MTFSASIDPEDLNSKRVIHGDGGPPGGDFTPCGFAGDSWEVLHKQFSLNRDKARGHVKEVDKTKPINCPNCIEVLEHYASNFFKKKGKWYQQCKD